MRISDVTRFAPINPFLSHSTVSSDLLDIIYDPLVEYDSQGKMKPALAERWKISEDGKEWSFIIRNGVKFHNGDALTAHDVKASLEAYKSMKPSFYAMGLSNVERIEAVSDGELKIVLKKYDSFVPFFLRHMYISPSSLLRKGISSLPVIGSGPFKLMSFSSEQIVLEANKNYFEGRPMLDKILVDLCSGQRACLVQVISGRSDIAFFFDAVDHDIFSNITDVSPVVDYAGGQLYRAIFNLRNPILKNANIRRALAYALDRGRMKSGAKIKGEADSAGSEFGVFFDFPYDPQRAARMLKGEGWLDRNDNHFLDRNGKDLKLVLSIAGNDDVSIRAAQMVKDDLEKVGIKVVIDALPSFKELVAKSFISADFDIIIVPSNIRGGLPLKYLFWHSSQVNKGGNCGGYINHEVDRMLDEVRYGSDQHARERLLRELLNQLLRDPPEIPLFVKRTPVLVNTKFTGFSSDPFEFFRSLRSVRIKDDK